MRNTDIHWLSEVAWSLILSRSSKTWHLLHLPRFISGSEWAIYIQLGQGFINKNLLGETGTVLTCTIEKDMSTDSYMQKTLHVEGRADLSQRSELHSKLLDALLGCNHLIVNLDKVSRFDGWLIALLCSVNKTSELLNKRLTIQGMEPGALGKGLCPKSEHCLLDNCLLSSIGQTAYLRPMPTEKHR